MCVEVLRHICLTDLHAPTCCCAIPVADHFMDPAPPVATLRRCDSHISGITHGSLLMCVSLICRVLLKCVCVLRLQRHFGEAIPISQVSHMGLFWLGGSLLMGISLICRVLLKCVCVLRLQRCFGEAIPISQIITNGSLL